MDTQAQDTLIAEIAELALGVALGIASRDDAEDLAQDVVLLCLRKLRAGQMPERPQHMNALVRRMVRQRAIDGERRRKTRKRRERQHGQDLLDSTHAWMQPDLASETARLEALRDTTLETMPEVRREIFVLVREKDTSYRAAAAATGLTPLAVCAHLVSANHTFRKRLREDGILVPRARASRSMRQAVAP